MAFTKITNAELNSRGATTLPNVPTIGATALKQEFDAPAKNVVAPKVNNLIDELQASTAAADLGAVAPTGRTGTSVQSVMNDISSDLATVESSIGGVSSDVTLLQTTVDELSDDVASVEAVVSGLSKTDLEDAIVKKHTHPNKSVIDKFTEDAEGNPLYDGSPIIGTVDYPDLTNKPKINNVTLSGNKSLADLGIDIPSSLSELSDDSTHRLVTDTEKSSWDDKAETSDIPTALADLTDDSTHRVVTDTEKTTWNGKQNTLTAGDNITIENNVISATGGTVKDAYKTIQVGSTNVVASGEDTLKLIAGTNVTITPNSATNEITISSSGGGGGSTGDMLKSIYDTNNDGIVNSADTISGLTASVAELNYASGVTSNIQAQLDDKAEISDVPTTLSALTDDATHRLVSDTEKTAWSGKSVVSVTQIKNSGEKIATVTVNGVGTDIYASSGGGGTSDYSDLTNKPQINNVTLSGNKTAAQLGFSDVATSGSYNDLTNKPTIPAAQVNADWNANSGVAQILNKPTIPTVTDTYSGTSSDGMSGKAVASAISGKADSDSLATVATSGSYNDLTDKPTIPTVNNGQLTIQQNGTSKATFTANQSGNATANIITDGWTATATVSSSGTVTFSGLNDSYGYKIYYTLPSGDSAYTFSKVTKSGSGTSVTLTYTTDAPSGTVCKLRILK